MAKAKKQPNYAQLRTELDDILVELQAGEIDIDQALAKYQRGLELLKLLETNIKQAENTIVELRTKFSDKTDSQ